MKKMIITIILVLSIFGLAFAGDGDLPNGGKNCPTNGACLVLQPEQAPINSENKTLFSIIKSLLDLF